MSLTISYHLCKMLNKILNYNKNSNTNRIKKYNE